MYVQRLPIEEWKAKKQAELKETIAAQKSALQEVVQDGQRLVDYLYGRGRLGSHITSGNAALVLQTLPQARAVLTAKEIRAARKQRGKRHPAACARQRLL